jgi:glycosyltransferase involved in cell wall biosynthesis
MEYDTRLASTDLLVQHMKKILLIAYHYYPDLQVGAQRTIKYVKYLPEFGWQPHVLTVHPRYYPQHDEAPLGFECPVYRTVRWPLPDDIYKSLKKLVKTAGAGSASHRQGSAPSSLARGQEPAPPTWKKFLNSLSMTPDGMSGWYFPAVLAARRLIRQHRFDVIYSSGPPHTCHLIGLTAHRLTGTPWVADFRDPWLFPKGRDKDVLSISKKFDIRYEAKTARYASLLVTTTDEWRDHLKQKYHPLLENKCHTVLNGFDTDDFAPAPDDKQESKSAPITLLYAGNLYAGRDPSSLLIAAGELVADGFTSANDLAIEFYGNNDIDMAGIDEIASSYGMRSQVRFNPPVSRNRYLDLLMNANILILIQADQGRVHIPAKAFEYLGTGNEILTLTSEGATRNFMSGFEQVALAELNDKGAIKEALRHLIDRIKKGAGPAATDAGLQAITKRSLTKKFAGLLDSIAADRSADI